MEDDDGHKDEEPYHAGIIVDDNEILHLSKENNILKENLELNVKKLNFALQPNKTSLPELEEDAEVYFITKNTSVKMIIHLLTPIKYPLTSQEGVVIIYHVEGWYNVEAVFTDIQYSMGKPCGQHNSTCIYLGNIGVVRKERTC
ncbi:4210_t:CDS:2 [Funneliformis geosporum]|uniref:4210_t:CDS:1 n=1 Tax=Funneliformis geosporum TaxID=1117311 RepID=A0A9W4SUF9_9GLOM|nr:4210_t:CDS:2 [Funneliformis geosporum]